MTSAQVAMYFLGALGLLLIAWVLWNAQHDPNNKIDLNYLLVDSQVGNITLGKFAGLISLVASTWIIVYLAVIGKFDGTAFAAYLAAWAAVKVFGDYTNKPTAGLETTVEKVRQTDKPTGETTTERETHTVKAAPLADDIEIEPLAVASGKKTAKKKVR